MIEGHATKAVSEIVSILFLWTHAKAKLPTGYMCVESLGLVHARSLVGACFSLLKPLWAPRLAGSADLLVGLLSGPGHSILLSLPPPHSSIKLPILGPVFGFASWFLFRSIAGQSLSEDSHERLPSRSLMIGALSRKEN